MFKPHIRNETTGVIDEKKHIYKTRYFAEKALYYNDEFDGSERIIRVDNGYKIFTNKEYLDMKGL